MQIISDHNWMTIVGETAMMSPLVWLWHQHQSKQVTLLDYTFVLHQPVKPGQRPIGIVNGQSQVNPNYSACNR